MKKTKREVYGMVRGLSNEGYSVQEIVDILKDLDIKITRPTIYKIKDNL